MPLDRAAQQIAGWRDRADHMQQPELTFSSDTAVRRRLLPDKAGLCFPAKMHTGLLAYLVRRYTRPGDIILDPFFGSGTTMLAALEGRHVIGVELELGWVETARRNVEHLAHSQLEPPTGAIVIRQGDSRYDLATAAMPPYADAAVFSPPFWADLGREGRQWEPAHYLTRMNVSATIEAQSGGYSAVDAVVTSPPYVQAVGGDGGPDHHPERMEGTAATPAAIKSGYAPPVDAVVTSPPYHDGVGIGGDQSEDRNLHLVGGDRTTIAAIRNGYRPPDTILTSPPFADRYSSTDPETAQAADPTASTNGRIHRPYSQSVTNIGNLKKYGDLDAVLTSPPYEQAVGSQRRNGGAGGKDLRDFLEHTGHEVALNAGRGYTAEWSPDNIGELRSQTYLEAMSLVYRGCYTALKPGGVCVVVIGNVVLDGREVRLDQDTARLLEGCGFVMREVLIHRKANLSFWRRLQHRKNPNSPLIDREYVLVADKPDQGGGHAARRG